MKFVLAATLLIALAGCTEHVGGDDIKAAEFACETYNGIQTIEPDAVYVTKVRCRTGIVFSLPDAITAYSDAVAKSKSEPTPTPQPEASK